MAKSSHAAIVGVLAILWAGLAAPRNAQAGGALPTTTIITHGFQTGSKGAWVESMASAVLARANGDGAVYRYTADVGAWARDLGPGGNGSDRNIVLIFNWEADSSSADEGPNWRYVQAAGDALSAMLRDPAYPPGTVGPGGLLAGRRVHFIGHSRGACVISEAIKRLAVAGIPIDQMTTFDPHPVNGTLDARYDLDWGDPVPERWANVAWADNYWRADGGGLINGLDFDGIPLANVLNVQLSESTLNCCGYAYSHSDVHLWYHGTVDLAPNASNGEQTITAQMRSAWWPQGAANVGFRFSAIGGGTRAAIPPGIVPPAGSVPLVENGAFDAGTRAGWAMHGGVGATLASASGNWFARLSSSRPRLVHNRMHFPAPPAPGRPLILTFKARRNATFGANDLLRVELERHEDAGPWAVSGGSWPVVGLQTAFSTLSVSLPPTVLGRTALLHVAIDGGGDAIGSTIELDDVSMSFGPSPADFNGDGAVDGHDLGVLLADWGPCGACSPDLNGDGVVDGIDLGRLLADWG
jgi:hypothetical protein